MCVACFVLESCNSPLITGSIMQMSPNSSSNAKGSAHVYPDPVDTGVVDTNVEDIEAASSRLDPINYLPGLCPLIFKHRDAIGLSEDQVADLRQWHDAYSRPMIESLKPSGESATTPSALI